MQKNLFLDIESTGTAYQCHGIIQIAAIAVIDGKVKGVFNEHLRPFKADYIDPIALEMQNLTEEEVRKRPAPKKVYRNFVKFLEGFVDKYDKEDKFTCFGYKIDFDIDFLSEFFKKNDDEYFGSYQNYRPVCTLALVRRLNQLGDCLITELPDLKLETVTEAFKIKHENPHDALSDARAARRVDFECMKRLRNIR